MANCVLPELWGVRVQPWMQALHSCFGIGAIIGPSLVGSFEWYNTFIIIAIASFVPTLGMICVEILGSRSNREGSVNYEAAAMDAEVEMGQIEPHADISRSSLDISVDSEIPEVVLVPTVIRVLLTLFFFFYVGAEAGFGGWISTYVLDEKLTVRTSDAAFIAAIFWAALTGGRVLAIPLAVVLTATTMLRIQLMLSAVGAILVVMIAPESYAAACVASAIFGFALSSIFPLAMTISADYGFTM